MWRIAQQKAYASYPPAVLKKHHNAHQWMRSMVTAILLGALRMWKVRCKLKKGRDYMEQQQFQRKRLLEIYHDIIGTKHAWPSFYRHALPTNLSEPETARMDALLHWINTYRACQMAEKTMQTPAPHTHDEWIKLNSQRKKGQPRQLYIQADGTLDFIHI